MKIIPNLRYFTNLQVNILEYFMCSPFFFLIFVLVFVTEEYFSFTLSMFSLIRVAGKSTGKVYVTHSLDL